MENKIFRAGNYTAKVVRCNTAIVGSGAAGFNAADRLWQLGQHDIVLVTENRVGGTSRNTGSDKQTYYKLTLSGGDPDSVREMADTLFAGRCVDGDIALCEAALSTQCFLKLVELGVPFPRNRYGEYIGYKTDHDPRRRATSVGPYTSKQMTECLEAAVQAKGVPMLDKTQVIKILTDGGTVCGLLCLNTVAQDAADRFTLIRCKNVIWATGGPAGMYADSVYPVQPVRRNGACAGSRRKGQKPDRMAVWACLRCAALECFRHLYAGAAAGIFHGGGRQRRARVFDGLFHRRARYAQQAVFEGLPVAV